MAGSSEAWEPFEFGSGAAIVAHPDDETIWAGGLILMHPRCRWTVLALCRASDADRAPKFRRALKALGASGDMGDLDDRPDQAPLADATVGDVVASMLPGAPDFGLVVTHAPGGEYTRHRRHEETSRAVAALWRDGALGECRLWMFAYEDDGGRRLPRAVAGAHLIRRLPEDVYRAKRAIITDIYGFAPDSFEARTTPETEAFWRFDSPASYERWLARDR